MPKTVTRHLANVTVQDPRTYKNLTVFPLVHPHAGDLVYLTLDEALHSGLVSITEVSKGGAVPSVRLANQSSRPVLILDGEELVGAKQNRVVNLTILAPAKATLDIPVSCVEAGRWSYRSEAFSSARRSVYASLRARKAEKVSRSMAMSGSRAADQGEIWGDIAAKSARMAAPSPTAAMAAMYERHQPSLEAFAENLRCGPGESGVIFAIGGRVVGFDLFDKPETLQKLYPKLVSSYALDALEDVDAPSAVPGVHKAEALITAVMEADQEEAFPAIGEGTDIRLRGADVVAAALVVGEQPLHVCGFRSSSEGASGEERGPIHRARYSRPSFRRRFRENGTEGS